MPVVAVINRKGGSGKSTLSTHLAAWLAHQGCAVMLGDVDRQQSIRAWLRRRPADLPAILPWNIDRKNVLKAPVGVTHVVLDTPGGLHGFELSRLVMQTDAIVMPVCNSLFDRESAADCHAELMAMPRVASGRCKLGVVGMRLDGRTRAAQTLRAWAEGLGMPFWGVLREAQIYVKSLESGQTLFDLPANVQGADLQQWQTILAHLHETMQLPTMNPPATPPRAPLAEHAVAAAPPPANDARVLPARAASLMPAQESMAHGDRFNVPAYLQRQ